jgi:transposase
MYRRCAGLDIHQKSIAVCIRIARAGKDLEVHTATFGTFTEDLERLRDWLRQHKVKQVGMESTGVYWIPIWNVLERKPARFELLLLNPQHVRALPGRKTDVQDCERIAELLQYGLVRASFVPPVPIRELRDLTRARVHVQQDRNRVINRIHRLLETANIKLASVLSNIVGKTGRSILDALATATLVKPESFAALATHKRLRAKQEELRKALRCERSDHFRFLLSELLSELDRLDAKLVMLERRIAERMRPYDDVLRRLCQIPGVRILTAWTVLAEIGTDMARFPDAAHLASWAGLCPGNSESAGKRHSGRTRKGNSYLRRALCQSAWAASRTNDSFLSAVFFRIARRSGLKKAALAIAHRLLTIIYTMLRDASQYRELGGDYFDRLKPERTAQRLLQRLDRLGFDIVIKPKPAT